MNSGAHNPACSRDYCRKRAILAEKRVNRERKVPESDRAAATLHETSHSNVKAAGYKRALSIDDSEALLFPNRGRGRTTWSLKSRPFRLIP
jgi:hypothetical protein